MWINILVFSRHNCIPALYSGLKPPRHGLGFCKTVTHALMAAAVCVRALLSTRRHVTFAFFFLLDRSSILTFICQSGPTFSGYGILMQLFPYIFYVCCQERLVF